MMTIAELLRTFGVDEEQLKGKSKNEQWGLVEQSFKSIKSDMDIEADRKNIENMAVLFPKLKELLSQNTDVYVRKAGQRKSPAVVKLVGFNPDNSELIVSHGGKLYHIPDADQIHTIEELADAKREKTPEIENNP